MLVGFAEAIVGGDQGEIHDAREAVRTLMGPEGMIDAAGVASNFQRMVRIADSTGIPLGQWLEEASRGVRTELGLQERAHA